MRSQSYNPSGSVNFSTGAAQFGHCWSGLNSLVRAGWVMSSDMAATKAGRSVLIRPYMMEPAASVLGCGICGPHTVHSYRLVQPIMHAVHRSHVLAGYPKKVRLVKVVVSLPVVCTALCRIKARSLGHVSELSIGGATGMVPAA
jgi:hypothetical protein